MSNIFGTLYTGISGLMTSQAGIDVTGHNIANANTEGYSRQRAVISTQNPLLVTPGPFGRGSKVEYIERTYDNVLADNLRRETSSLSYWSSLQTSLDEVSIYFNELESGSGLGDALKDYFNAWQSLANTAPDNSDESQVKKIELINKTDILTSKIQESYTQLERLQGTSDFKIEQYVNEINDIAENIRQINIQIGKVEAGENKANDFRDQRELLLNKLSEYVNITTSERDDGQIAVLVGGITLVDSDVINEIYTVKNEDNDNHYDIYWGTKGSNNPLVDITSKIYSGKLAGELKTRDETLTSYKGKLDELAQTLIKETNRIHSTGLGVERFNSITSTNGVQSPTFIFTRDAGKFPYDINEGTFRIAVYNSEGEVSGNFDIDINPEEDNLYSVIEKINQAGATVASGKISAQLSSGNTIKITAEEGYTFSFVEDTTNFLVASGLYGYFKGSGASDIAVNDFLATNPNFIATAKSTAPGDNSNALELSNLKFSKLVNGNYSIDEFYSVFTTTIAADKNQVNTFYDSKKQSVDQFTMKLEQIKGVSIDEEFTNLIKFQKAYEANARFITAVDQMIDKLINGVGLVGR
ncbi:flagellar hook-associated protein FlgK [Deferribacterales bacterium Es71-Z0220]|uniref:flagellar hook-associated protein FlgK n=1 Tax=Deferrivibrio essentukiensis TaxID=2880922 RepID=UPI001F6054F5|nr:flagellar hook-associated protein FlgK [Deferrivibrio essentukiensis]MCB4203378.1 flagellar hook-associated protein FlgK [Deferrivibrio essentukiensis]